MSHADRPPFGSVSRSTSNSFWDSHPDVLRQACVREHQEKLAKLHQELTHSTVPFRDYIFTEEAWRRHHSWRRYLPEPYILFRLLKRLFPQLSWVFLVSVACGIYQSYRHHDWPSLDELDIAFTFTLLGFALSLLLVFKTNASYARWVEARAAWAGVYGNVRALLNKTQAFAGYKMGQPQRRMLTRWVIAMPYVLRAHLLSYVPGSLALEPLLTATEYEWLLARPHMPMAVAQMLAAILNTVTPTIEAVLLAHLHIELTGYIQNSVTCERLTRTPVPLAYTRHTIRFLIVYLSSLPLALWARIHWLTLVVAPVAAFLLVGIENIGNQIENPLLVLPMAAYCSKVHFDVIGMTELWAAMDDRDPYKFVRSLLEEAAPEWQDGGAHDEPDGKPVRRSLESSSPGSRSRSNSRTLMPREVPDLLLGDVKDVGDDETFSSLRNDYERPSRCDAHITLPHHPPDLERLEPVLSGGFPAHLAVVLEGKAMTEGNGWQLDSPSQRRGTSNGERRNEASVLHACMHDR